MSVPKAGALGKASDWTTVFPLDTDAGASWTPVLTQSGVVTKTVNSAQYFKVGRMTLAQTTLTVIGGAPVATNNVVVSLPVNAGFGFVIAGSVTIFDTSAGARYQGMPALISASTMGGIPTSANNNAFLGNSVFTAALAVGDTVDLMVIYMAAS